MRRRRRPPLLLALACAALAAAGCDPPTGGDADENGALPDGPGKDLFLGEGNCSTCHGEDATGTTVGPDLTDGVWIHGDGSLAFIRGIIQNGVPEPIRYPAPMPPEGGADLTEEQVEILAQFVFDISH